MKLTTTKYINSGCVGSKGGSPSCPARYWVSKATASTLTCFLSSWPSFPRPALLLGPQPSVSILGQNHNAPSNTLLSQKYASSPPLTERLLGRSVAGGREIGFLGKIRPALQQPATSILRRPEVCVSSRPRVPNLHIRHRDRVVVHKGPGFLGGPSTPCHDRHATAVGRGVHAVESPNGRRGLVRPGQHTM